MREYVVKEGLIMKHRIYLLAILIFTLAWESQAETARVCELTLSKFVEGRYDLNVRLYHRDGKFYHGYALPGQRDNLPHRVDPTPAAPFEFVYTNGKKLKIKPEWKGTYAYWDAEWKKLEKQYREGKLKARRYDEPKPVIWDGKQLSGTLDVWIMPVDKANLWGLNAPKTFLTFRIIINANEKNKSIEGTFEAWQYQGGDETFGAGAERFRGRVKGLWLEDFWETKPGTEYAAGKDWPCARGPYLNGSAVDCGSPLVDNLHDARLLWVAEDIIPAGKGGAPKVSFGFYPANWSGLGYGAFGGPVVMDGKVYTYFMYPDLEKLEADPRAKQHILYYRGADIGILGSDLNALRHTVFCFDARSGRRLWKWQSEKTFGKPASGKSGKGLTPCVYNGKVYARGAGIYCLNTETGRLLWTRAGRDKKDRSYRTTGGWSRDQSPVVIGGTLVFHGSPDTTLVGLNPETGEELWRREKVCGWNAIPTKIALEGKEYIITAYGVDIRTKDDEQNERMVLIEPKTGRIIWENNQMGKTGVSLAVWDDIVCGNITPGLSGAEGKGVDDRMRAGAFEVSLAGAVKLWASEKVGYPPHRATPIAHKSFFYIDSRSTGFACVHAKTGKVVAQHPHIHEQTGGDHNWTWHLATNNRIITSGILMFSCGSDGFKQLPGRLSLDLVSGYMCPVKPAIADGRLFVRTLDKLVCYDLRKPKDYR
jgi:outer membrane protein assembly factor BamB